ncbi:MAG: hypothetical protein QHJ82_06360 [Verrucomicrobiota bacterium]|nr:hypothetical protein [Verrucomicrobiota bacterium]
MRMGKEGFDEVVDQIVEKDKRFHRDAYVFVTQAVEFTQKAIGKANKGRIRHISGQELLAGIKTYALDRYGPMAITLFDEWGVKRCEDFGEIVFNLVDHGLLKKTETDSRADFQGGYDFYEAFRKPFLPKNRQGTETEKKSSTSA